MRDDRPMVCRLFGTVDHPHMECPKGRGPKRKLTDAQGNEIMAKWYQIIGGATL